MGGLTHYGVVMLSTLSVKPPRIENKIIVQITLVCAIKMNSFKVHRYCEVIFVLEKYVANTLDAKILENEARYERFK